MSDIEKTSLALCPACGGEAEAYVYPDELTSTKIQDVVTIRCSNVLCVCHWIKSNCDTREQAVKAWNNQPHIEELEKASADLYNVMLTIAENEGILEKESADEFYNCMVRVKQLLKGKSDE